jgi:hypothetical protein
MKAILRALVGVLAIAGLLLWPQASLAEGDIVVTSATHQNAYPTKISFALKAQSNADITKVKFNYRILGDPTTNYAYPEDFKSGQTVDVTYELNTQKSYVPPEVELRYYWDIEDAAGHTLRTEPTTFAVSDTRFQWQKVEQDNVAILWYQGDEEFARGMLTAANTALGQLSKDAGIVPKDKVKILAYASQSDMLGALQPSAQEWTGGQAFSAQGIIVLAAPPTSSGREFAARAIPHELSHVVVFQATDNPYGDLPQWLNEGLAMYSEGEMESTYTSSLDRAVKGDSLLSLQTLSSNFPADPDAAALSYAESYSVVKYIIDKYGRDGMSRLLKVFSEGSTYDAAIKTALGVPTMAGLEREWKASLGIQPAASGGDGAGGEATAGGQGKATATSQSPAGKAEPCGALPFSLVVAVAVLAVKRMRS